MFDKLRNVRTSLNNLKTKVDELDVQTSKTTSVDLKKLKDVLDNEVVKKTEFSTLKKKVNNIDKKNHYATSLIRRNQYNTDQENLEK